MIKVLTKFKVLAEELALEVDKYNSKVRGIVLGSKSINLDEYPHLKVISRLGVGTDNIDFNKCNKRDIKVYNTSCAELVDAVAEFTLMQMLNLLRNSNPPINLDGRSVGIIGYGMIGRTVRNSLCTNYSTAYDIDEGKTISETKEQLLKESDIVTIHVSGNKEVIGFKELEMMKEGSYLINTAREKCVDMKAVAKALKSGKLAGFASDVNKCFSYKYQWSYNTLFTDHIAGNTYEARNVMEKMCIDNLRKGLEV